MEANNQKINLNSVYLPSEKVITREIEGELIIVPIESGVADFDDALYSLNDTGSVIWNLLDRRRTVNNICSILSESYSAPLAEIEKDALLLLEKLLSLGIIIKA